MGLEQQITAWRMECLGIVHPHLRQPQRTQQNCIVICHAGSIRMLTACLRNLSLTEMAQFAVQKRHKIAYGDVIVLDC